jgi:hypothetical protein
MGLFGISKKKKEEGYEKLYRVRVEPVTKEEANNSKYSDETIVKEDED